MNSRKPAYKLVIVESPAKARTISKFLGRSYKVEASQGHVRDLPKSQLGVDVEHNFEPKYITIRGRGEVLERIRKEAKGAKSVILATDPDREGEAISWHLATILGIDPESACRVEFNEITEKTVKSAIKQPRAVNMQLVNAQQARRMLDRLVGYKISPLLWVKIKKGLSACSPSPRAWWWTESRKSSSLSRKNTGMWTPICVRAASSCMRACFRWMVSA